MIYAEVLRGSGRMLECGVGAVCECGVRECGARVLCASALCMSLGVWGGMSE